MFRLFVCMAFALALIGCGSQQLPTTLSDAARRIPYQVASPSTVPVRGTSPAWQIDGDSNPKNYEPATEGQCTGFSFPTDSSVYFQFKRSKTSCYRDQLNPLSSPGVLYYLNLGQTYTWKFQTLVNANAGAIMWQIHPETCSDITPPVGLNVDASKSPPTWHVWVYVPGMSKAWYLPYKNKSTDTWEFQANMAGNSAGWVKAWHNGTQFVSQTGINYPTACKKPFWNLGPYPSEWKKPSSPGNYIDATFNYMDLSTS